MQRKPCSQSSVSWYSQMFAFSPQAWLNTMGLPLPQSVWKRLVPSAVSMKERRGVVAASAGWPDGVPATLSPDAISIAPVPAAAAAELSMLRRLMRISCTMLGLTTSARRRGVDEADHRLDAAVFGQHREVGALDVERRFPGAAGHPAEADVIVVRFDAAAKIQAVAGKVIQRGANHGGQRLVAAAVAGAVDIAAVLGPRLGDEIAAPLGVGLVPGGE